MTEKESGALKLLLEMNSSMGHESSQNSEKNRNSAFLETVLGFQLLIGGTRKHRSQDLRN